MRRPTRAELNFWYGRIREVDPAWVDIEGGRDYAELPRSTLPGGSGARGTAVMCVPEIDGETDWRDTPTAQFWRLVAAAAHRLPRRHPDRKFLIDASQREVTVAARAAGLSDDQGWRRWWAFLRGLGLPRRSYARSERGPGPAPVHVFTLRERQALMRAKRLHAKRRGAVRVS